MEPSQVHWLRLVSRKPLPQFLRQHRIYRPTIYYNHRAGEPVLEAQVAHPLMPRRRDAISSSSSIKSSSCLHNSSSSVSHSSLRKLCTLDVDEVSVACSAPHYSDIRAIQLLPQDPLPPHCRPRLPRWRRRGTPLPACALQCATLIEPL